MTAVRPAVPILALLLALLAAGCAPPAPEALRFGLPSAPVSLDPRYATDATGTRINRLLYRPLVDFDDRRRPVPLLATWERLSPTRYRFRLGREGRRFHDGTRLTAADVVATYRHVLDPDQGSPHRGSLDHVTSVTAPDPETVEFRLSRPDPLFPGRLVLGIVPARFEGRRDALAERPVGSGPFAFVARPREDRLELERLADGRHVRFLRVPDPTVRVLKLLRGELDLVQGEIPPELLAWADTREDLVVLRARGSNFTYLGFNLEDPVVGRRAVRLAIAHALDREAIIRHVMGGAARPASALLPPDHWAGHPGLRPYEHAPERARALLAGLPEALRSDLRVTYKTSSNPFRVRLATVIQHQLAQVGLPVEVRSYDWGTFYGDIKAGRFQMFSLSWVGIKMPDIFRYVFHSSAVPPAGANRGRYRNEQADALIERADRTLDRERQAALYRELQAHLLETLPYVPLWYEDHVAVLRPGVVGYSIPVDGNFDGLADVRRTRGG